MSERNHDAVIDLEILVELLLLRFVLKAQHVADAILDDEQLVLDGLRLELAAQELDALGLVAAADRPQESLGRPVKVAGAEVEHSDAGPVQKPKPGVEA